MCSTIRRCRGARKYFGPSCERQRRRNSCLRLRACATGTWRCARSCSTAVRRRNSRVSASFGVSTSTAPIPEFQRVLVTTDFSERGNHAIPFAYSALAHGGTVRLVHVMPPFNLPSPLVPHYARKTRSRKDHAKLFVAWWNGFTRLAVGMLVLAQRRPSVAGADNVCHTHFIPDGVTVS